MLFTSIYLLEKDYRPLFMIKPVEFLTGVFGLDPNSRRPSLCTILFSPGALRSVMKY